MCVSAQVTNYFACRQTLLKRSTNKGPTNFARELQKPIQPHLALRGFSGSSGRLALTRTLDPICSKWRVATGAVLNVSSWDSARHSSPTWPESATSERGAGCALPPTPTHLLHFLQGATASSAKGIRLRVQEEAARRAQAARGGWGGGKVPFLSEALRSCRGSQQKKEQKNSGLNRMRLFCSGKGGRRHTKRKVTLPPSYRRWLGGDGE